MEALRLDNQREILDMEIKAEEEKKRENKNDELSLLETSSSITCNSPYGDLDDILGLKEKLPFLPTIPPHLEIRPVAIVNPPGPPQIKSLAIEASIIRMISKTERAIEGIKRFRTSLDDVENRTNDVLRDFDRVKPNRNDVEDEREKMDETIHIQGEEELHWMKLKQLDDYQAELVRIHQETQTLCSRLTQGENSNTNFTRAKNLSPLPSQQLYVLEVPSLYEFISNVRQIQGSQGIFAPGGALHKSLVNKILESLGEHEPDAVQDIKNEKSAETVDSVVQYLVRHYGSPAMVEALAQRHHEEIGRLFRPFLENNTAVSHAAIKAHRSTMNSVSTMIAY